jgi:hypothetical protein
MTIRDCLLRQNLDADRSDCTTFAIEARAHRAAAAFRDDADRFVSSPFAGMSE